MVEVTSGWVKKQGSGFFTTGNKRRYIILNMEGKAKYPGDRFTLKYYAESAPKFRGTIDLTEMSEFGPDLGNESKFFIKTTTPARTWNFEVYKKEDRPKFLQGLQKIKEEVVEYKKKQLSGETEEPKKEEMKKEKTVKDKEEEEKAAADIIRKATMKPEYTALQKTFDEEDQRLMKEAEAEEEAIKSQMAKRGTEALSSFTPEKMKPETKKAKSYTAKQGKLKKRGKLGKKKKKAESSDEESEEPPVVEKAVQEEMQPIEEEDSEEEVKKKKKSKKKMKKKKKVESSDEESEEESEESEEQPRKKKKGKKKKKKKENANQTQTIAIVVVIIAIVLYVMNS